MRTHVLLLSLLATLPVHAEVKVATMDFTTRGLQAKAGAAWAERFALYLRKEGLSVTTTRDIAAVLSLERQKQLLGCSEGQATCLTELAGALGVEAVVTGQVGRVGKSLQVTVKVVNATTAAAIFELTRSLKTEDEVLEALEAAAPEAARKVALAFPTPVATPDVPRDTPQPVLTPAAPPKVAVTPPPLPARAAPVGPWVVTSVGGVALGAGAGLLLASALTAPTAVSADVTPSAATALDARAARLRTLGGVTAGVGAVVMATGLVWLARSGAAGGADAPTVSLSLDGRQAVGAVAFVW